ncbi:MAG: ATP-dependent DNA helicase PcrA [Ruminococcaceae bacterium]|nr:ATP-dependent DNA helicase PcrA [Oscillospiraceae bacterium]
MTNAGLRDRVIEKDFNRMNNMQLRAVTATDGPVLVLAGAGSGKTTVLVNRIACLVKYGSAYKCADEPFLSDIAINEANAFLNGDTEEIDGYHFAKNPAKPWQILAITFTNKAANELKERIAAKLGDQANDIWAGTFHSVCGKILRRFADRIGYTSHFTIYDTDDQKKLIKEIMKNDGIDEKMLPVKAVLSAISHAKDRLITPEEFSKINTNFRDGSVAKIYKKYAIKMINNDAMDFDDMINNTVKLFRENPDVLDYYQEKFRYIMVDEYQDTNHAQYVLISLLADKYKNICVVGDDDQSIYHFRGATIENILNFEDEYRNARVIRLEQNYRSTGNILDVANAVIKNNKGRKGKNLWTENGQGKKVVLHTAPDEKSEASFIADKILENVRGGDKFSDHAVLYRMNAQSNALENVFARSGISYRVIGGTKFFERKEIKDVLAYLHIISNPYDDLRLKRIINEPKRSIGGTTIDNASQISDSLGLSLYEVLKNADEYPMLSRAAAKIKQFCEVIDELRAEAQRVSIHELFENMLDKTGYLAALKAAGEEEQDRVDNINEFASNIVMYELENETPTLSGFLEEIALVTDLDSMDSDDKVTLMTIHSAKGLEFNKVFISGMEEGIFPGHQSIYDGPEAIEEERRLAYVAITRAKRELTITNTTCRLLFGSTVRNVPSRFLREVPEEFCEVSRPKNAFSAYAAGGYGERRTISASTQSYGHSAPRFTTARPKDTNKYAIGMNVEHNTFGEGVILSVNIMGEDSLLEINFKKVGTKKLMANYAKLKII